MQSKDVLEYVVYGMVALAILEGVISYFLTRKSHPKEVLANIGVWTLQKVWREVLGVGSITAIFYLAAKFAPAQLPNTWWAWIIAIVGADFIYYWKHRFEHEIRILWAYHSVHHSSPEFNLSTAMRLPLFGTLSVVLFHLPLVFLGVSPAMLIVSRQLVLLYQYWVHSSSIGKLGWLELILNTPSAHRVHHGSNARYLDKNYGGILILWDKWFGTFEPESADEPVVYGLTKPINTQNPFKINLIEPLAIARDIAKAGSIKEAVGYVFGPPGWTPDTEAEAFASTSASLVPVRINQQRTTSLRTP